MKNKKAVVQKQKKSYMKPEIKKVQLRPEEAVLGGCKIDGPGAGPFQARCDKPASCSTIGIS